MSELLTFFQVGFRHIVSVEAMDHVLFLLVLAAIYRFRDWRDALWVVSAFTVGHSVTLALAVMSDAALASGDSAQAEEYARVMEVSVRRQAGALHRGWGLFLLDRGRRIDQVAAQAAHDLEARPDIYGYDLLAWALHGQGRDAEAARAMAGALRLGTRDATLFYHAGMIERAAGNLSAARAYLRRALAVSRYFDVAGPAVARATLDSLGG